MIKLKEVINQLEDTRYLQLESNLIKNKADRFLFLLQTYKKSNVSDNEIKKALGVTTNSFYVLKSRLYDKIQDSLSSDLFIDQEKTIKLLLQVPDLCLNSPRETSVAYLLKLEKDLLLFDMHHELLIVYSALKKMHLNHDKYYYYSQLYNKQVSFGLSLEKAEETLGDFCRILGQYELSKSNSTYEKLVFLKQEINNAYDLCKSRQIEIIKNLIEIQLSIFGKKNNEFESNTNELLQQTRIIFDELPVTINQKKWEIVLDYLCFEYYYSIGLIKSANQYFEKINNQISNFLLYNHIALVSKFLISKIKFCYEFEKQDEIMNIIDTDRIMYDTHDSITQIALRMYNSMIYFNQKNYKKAISCIDNIQYEFVFKDYFYEFLNIKLTLTYFYIVAGDFENADICLKILNRRVKSENIEEYKHVLYLLKSFHTEINKDSTSKSILKQRDLFILFNTSNNSKYNYELVPHLVTILKKKYQI